MRGVENFLKPVESLLIHPKSVRIIKKYLQPASLLGESRFTCHKNLSFSIKMSLGTRAPPPAD